MNNAQSLPSPLAVGRIDTDQVARLIGFAASDIAVLSRAGLLKPLGRPSPNAPKYYAAAEILQLAANREWLDKATRATSQHWRERNERSRGRQLRSAPKHSTHKTN